MSFEFPPTDQVQHIPAEEPPSGGVKRKREEKVSGVAKEALSQEEQPHKKQKKMAHQLETGGEVPDIIGKKVLRGQKRKAEEEHEVRKKQKRGCFDTIYENKLHITGNKRKRSSYMSIRPPTEDSSLFPEALPPSQKRKRDTDEDPETIINTVFQLADECKHLKSQGLLAKDKIKDLALSVDFKGELHIAPIKRVTPFKRHVVGRISSWLGFGNYDKIEPDFKGTLAISNTLHKLQKALTSLGENLRNPDPSLTEFIEKKHITTSHIFEDIKNISNVINRIIITQSEHSDAKTAEKIQNLLFAKGQKSLEEPTQKTFFPTLKETLLQKQEYIPREIKIEKPEPIDFSKYEQKGIKITKNKQLPRQVDAKMTIHVLGDAFAMGSDLEGSTYSRTLGFIHSFLQSKDIGLPVDPKLCSELVEGFKISLELEALFEKCSNLKETAQTLQKHVQESIQNNSPILIPGGWTGAPSGHAMLYEFIPQGDEFLVRIYNSGSGIQYHPSMEWAFQEKHAPFIEFTGIPIAKLSSEEMGCFFQSITELKCMRKHVEDKSDTKFSEKDVYGVLEILSLCGGKRVAPSSEMVDLLMNPQRSGTCAWKSICAFLRSKLPYKEYKLLKYHIKLQTTIAYFQNNQHNFENDKLKLELMKQSLDMFSKTVKKCAQNGYIPASESEAVLQMMQDMSQFLNTSEQRMQQKLTMASAPPLLKDARLEKVAPRVFATNLTSGALPEVAQVEQLAAPSVLSMLPASEYEYRGESFIKDLTTFIDIAKQLQKNDQHTHVVVLFSNIIKQIPSIDFDDVKQLETFGKDFSEGKAEKAIMLLTEFSELFFKSCFFVDEVTNISPEQLFVFMKATELQRQILLSQRDTPPDRALNMHCLGTMKDFNRKDVDYPADNTIEKRWTEKNLYFRLQGLRESQDCERLFNNVSYGSSPFSLPGTTDIYDGGDLYFYLKNYLSEEIQGKSEVERCASLLALDDEKSPLPKLFLARRRQIEMFLFLLNGPCVPLPELRHKEASQIQFNRKVSKGTVTSTLAGVDIDSIVKLFPKIDYRFTGTKTSQRFTFWEDRVENPVVKFVLNYFTETINHTENDILFLEPPSDLGISKEELVSILKIGCTQNLRIRELFSYFRDNVTKLQDPSYRTLFSIFLLENNLLKKALDEDPKLASTISEWISKEYEIAKIEQDIRMCAFFLGISDIVSERAPKLNLPQQVEELSSLLSSSGRTAEEKYFLSRELLIAYREYDKLSAKAVQEILMAKHCMESTECGLQDVSQKKQLEAHTAFCQLQPLLEKALSNSPQLGGSIAKNILQETLGTEVQTLSRKATLYSSDSYSVDLLSGRVYSEKATVKILPSRIANSVEYKRVFHEGALPQIAATNNQYTFLDASYVIVDNRSKIDIFRRFEDENAYYKLIEKETLITGKEYCLESKWLTDECTVWINREKTKAKIVDATGTVVYEASLERERFSTISSCHGTFEGMTLLCPRRIPQKKEDDENLYADENILFLSQVEDPNYIHILSKDPASSQIDAIELPRLGLSFKRENNRFYCIEKPGFFLSKEQKLLPLAHFSHYLTVSSDAGLKIALIPDHSVEESKKKSLLGIQKFKKDTKDKKIPIFEIEYKSTAKGYKELDYSSPEKALFLAKLFLLSKEYEKAFYALRPAHLPVSKITKQHRELLENIASMGPVNSDDYERALGIRLYARFLQHELAKNTPEFVVTPEEWSITATDLGKYVSLRQSTNFAVLSPEQEVTLLRQVKKHAPDQVLPQMERLLERYTPGEPATFAPSPQMPAAQAEKAFIREKHDIEKLLKTPIQEKETLLVRPKQKAAFYLTSIINALKSKKPLEPELKAKLLAAKSDPDPAISILVKASLGLLMNPGLLDKASTAEKDIFESIIEPAFRFYEWSAKELPPEKIAQAEPKLRPKTTQELTEQKLQNLLKQQKEFAFSKIQGTLPPLHVIGKELKALVKLTTPSDKEIEEKRENITERKEALKKSFLRGKNDPCKFMQDDCKGILEAIDKEEARLLSKEPKADIELAAIEELTNTLPAYTGLMKGELQKQEQNILSIIEGAKKPKENIQPFGIDDLLLLFGTQNLSLLQNDYNLLDTQIQELELALDSYAKTLLDVQKCQRILLKAEQANACPKDAEHSRELKELKLELCREITQETLAEVLQDPRFLAFELFCNFTCRKEQLDVLKRFLQAGDAKEANIIVQMIMGSGKTSVILPLLSLLKADGKTLPIVLLPKELVVEVSEDIRKKIASVYGLKVHVRTMDPKRMEHDPDYIRELYEELETVQKERGCLIMDPNTAHGYAQFFIDKLRQEVKSPSEDSVTSIRQLEYLRKSLYLLKTSGSVQIDESDLLLTSERENNLLPASAESKKIPQEEIRASKYLYDLLLDSKNIALDFTQKKQGKEEVITKELYNTKVRPALTEKFLNALTNSQSGLLSKNALNILQKQTLKQQEFIKQYLETYEEDPSNPLIGVYEHIETLPEEIQNSLAIARYELHVLLPSTILATCDESYKIDDTGQTAYAVPATKGKVEANSQFASAHETLNYTYQAYLKGGVPEAIFRRKLIELQNAIVQDIRMGIPQKDSESYKTFQKLLPEEFHDISLLLRDAEHLNRAMLHMKNTKEAIFLFVNSFVVPEILQQPESIRRTGADLVNLPCKAGGFSGTRGVNYPSKLAVYERYDIDAKTLFAIQKVADVGAIDDSTLETLANSLLKGPEKVVIDAGGLFNDQPRDVVVQKLLQTLASRGIFAIVSHNPQDILVETKVLLDSKGDPQFDERGNLLTEKVPFSGVKSPASATLFFQPFTTGADIKHDYDEPAVITCSRNTKLRDELQGAGRMRKLVEGEQRVRFCATNDFQDIVKTALKLEKSDVLKPEDILYYNTLVEATHKEQYAESWMRQELASKAKEAVFSLLLKTPITSTQELQTRYSKAVDDLFVSKKPSSASSLYGGRQTTKTRDVVFQNIIDDYEKALTKIQMSDPCFQALSVDGVINDMKTFVHTHKNKCRDTLVTGSSDIGKRVTVQQKTQVKVQQKVQVAAIKPQKRFRYYPHRFEYGESLLHTPLREYLQESPNPNQKLFAEKVDPRIEISNNLAPLKAQSHEDFTVAAGTLSEKEMRYAMVCQNRDTGEYRIHLLDQRAASNFLNALKENQISSADARFLHVAFGFFDSKTGSFLDYQKQFAQNIQEDLQGIFCQLKVLAKQRVFDDEEKKYLRGWLGEKLFSLYEQEVIQQKPPVDETLFAQK